ncbi:alpha-ketoglutarate-dependent dioxygenase AlkB [Nocardia brasiliensis]|uniref:alpha-ketoglutarate-dependent dioxygenase AlkB n=1 Tax=Nocardia brasiliensis TaxID=37326 RepID=UPI003D90869A
MASELVDIAGVAGLRQVPDWIDEERQTELLARIDAAPWSSELSRRVQHFGHRYDLGHRPVITCALVPPPPEWARELGSRLDWADPPDQVIINEYLPGQGVDPRVDCALCFGPAIAVLSLGSACTMDFLDPDSNSHVPIGLPGGSLCEMRRDARYRWHHAIAARKTDPSPAGQVPRGRRVSVTFRTVRTM